MPRKARWNRPLDMVGQGENPNGYTSITPNGVAKQGFHANPEEGHYWRGTDGERWNGAPGGGMIFTDGEAKPRWKGDRSGE